ncbi:sensor histidine kinase [Lysobacter koreensis]|uniref:histidine kinase n=1 Tax=Lysobacter koreensis TaxID=266122 RepID=A0ABW2YNI7_9GAMM
MPQGLPRKIKLAFIGQALTATLVIVLGVGLGGLLVRQWLINERMDTEAQAFWDGYRADPAHPLPQGAMMVGYLERPGSSAPALPDGVRELPAGLNSFVAGNRVVYVDRRPEGTLYLLLRPLLLDRGILWTALSAALLSLWVVYLTTWLTYRTSKRLVTPVTWLAHEVSKWDPRAPDAHTLAPANLPDEAGSEVQALSQALSGLAARIGRFVQRERDFTRDASHELRTPLTVIRMATDLLLADPEMSARTQRSLSRIQLAGRDMEMVIDAFLILAREGDIEPVREPFEVRDIVDGEVARVQPLLADKQVELRVVDEGAPCLVAPPQVLRVMLGNLLSNAVNFTQRGQIELRLLPDRIEVHDSGIGMSAEAIAKAFDPFYRADFSRPESKGVGLSIVGRLAERFNWPVSLTSVPGEGTTAVIRFNP